MSLTKQAQDRSIQTIDSLLAELNKSAEAGTEPGGYDGPSSHPTAKAEDATQAASEGPRSSENSSDVKEQVGAPSVENGTGVTGGGQDAGQPNMGTHQSATGEDPSVETASAKGGKEDGGYDGPSSHPARTDNESLDGGKFASDGQRALAMIKQASTAGSELLARIVVEADSQRKQAAALPAKTAADAQEAGSQLAANLVQPASTLSQPVVETIKNAYVHADLVATFLKDYQTKLADDDEGDDDDAGESDSGPAVEKKEPAIGGGGESDAGGDAGGEPAPMPSPAEPAEAPMPPMGDMGAMGGAPGGAPGGEPMIPLSVVMQLLSGGGMGGDPMAAAGGDPMAGADVGGGDALAAMGGEAPPVDPAAAGGDPMAAAGGDPMAGGGGGEEQAMLAEALAQGGIPPEAMKAAAVVKMAAAMTGKKLTPGSWRPKTAAEGAKFQKIQNYVQELVGSAR